EVNIGDTYIDVPLHRTDPGQVAVTLQIGYQGCKDNSLCYPPIKKTMPLVLAPVINSGGSVTGITAAIQSGAVSTAQTSTPMVSEHDSFTLKLMEGSVLFNVLLFFGAGLLLSFTPCVFPMIPIL